MRVFSRISCLATFSVPIVLVGACGATGGATDVAFEAAGHAEFPVEVESLSLNITDISVSETGESWTLVGSYNDAVSLEPGSTTELIIENLPTGEYHGVKVQFASGFSIAMNDDSIVDAEFPIQLLYEVNGIHRYSNTGNGFPDTVEYFMFTTRNGALSSPVEVEPGDPASLVFEFEPMYPFVDVENNLNGLGLSASVHYTAFLY